MVLTFVPIVKSYTLHDAFVDYDSSSDHVLAKSTILHQHASG